MVSCLSIRRPFLVTSFVKLGTLPSFLPWGGKEKEKERKGKESFSALFFSLFFCVCLLPSFLSLLSFVLSFVSPGSTLFICMIEWVGDDTTNYLSRRRRVIFNTLGGGRIEKPLEAKLAYDTREKTKCWKRGKLSFPESQKGKKEESENLRRGNSFLPLSSFSPFKSSSPSLLV